MPPKVWNALPLTVFNFPDDITGHMMILDVRFGKFIPDRRNVTGFGCAVTLAAKIPLLGWLQESFSFNRARIVRVKGVPSLYLGIAKLEHWQIALLAGHCPLFLAASSTMCYPPHANWRQGIIFERCSWSRKTHTAVQIALWITLIMEQMGW